MACSESRILSMVMHGTGIRREDPGAAAELHGICTGTQAQAGCSLPREFHQKLLEGSEAQVVWLSVAAFLTWEVPHALQWWEVRDVAAAAHHIADSALGSSRCSGGGTASSSMYGATRGVSTGGAAAGASGGHEGQHAWLVVAWALLALEGACSVATGVPFEDRRGLCSPPQHYRTGAQC